MENFSLQHWTKEDYNSLILHLKAQADLKYKKFHSGIMPNTAENYIIGVRMPILRKIAGEISKGNGRDFLQFVLDDYYEEAMLYGLVLSKIKTQNYEDFCYLYDKFVDRINNWAVCDTCSGKSKDFKKYKEQYFLYLENYIQSDNPWAIRYAIITMFNYKKDAEYLEVILQRLNKITNDYYYVKMAKAWLCAELFVFDKERIYNFLRENNFDKETMLMTFSKLRDSLRVSSDDKEKLKALKNLKFNLTNKDTLI